MKICTLWILFGLLLLNVGVLAQQSPRIAASARLTGTLVSETDGSPVVGATITVKNAKNSVVTGLDGTFTIAAPPRAMLVISSIGFKNH